MAELPISRDDAADEIKAFLLDKGVESVTSKDIRKHLEQKFDCALGDHKAEIDRIKLEKIEEIKKTKTDEKSSESSESDVDTDEEKDAPDPPKGASTSNTNKSKTESDSESDFDLPASEKNTRSATKRKRQPAKEKAPARKRKGDSGFTVLCELSEELQEVMGRKYMRRHDVVKAMWVYFKANDLLDPKDRRKVICNEPLKRIFGLKKFQAFGMMGGLKEHINPATDLSEEERAKIIAELDPDTPEGEEPQESSRQKKTKKGKVEGAPRKDGAFTKILKLSDELAAILGHKYMRRNHVMKAMWAYFKEHDLVDPSNRRMVILNDELKKIFDGEKTVQALGMMRYLKSYMENAEFSDEETRAKVTAECDAMFGGVKSKNGDVKDVPTTSRNGARRTAPKRSKKAESEKLSSFSDSSDSPPPAEKSEKNDKEEGAGDAKNDSDESSSSSSSSDSDSD